ncbi:glucosamine-6-phosphate deaminase [Cohnella pontilimi]|uniref:Glucosamine-6-phosphate deaminase n=1 Tax=Cohnella pontilimi TaxID=2564100 RepID=A0A4U0F893_9BACL|nr:glucosamine-6-phosphate deaminase [Cohnella pontilimi]TJY40740.1 glucosamine-6-phosphate deaminase [Cohnella pontilimi]
MKQLTIDHLTVLSYPTRREMGDAVAADVKAQLKKLLQEKETVTLVLASAPSQNDFLDSLRSQSDDIPWDRIVCFHLDEYVGLPQNAPQSFSTYLQNRIFSVHTPKLFHRINGLNDADRECLRYSELLAAQPIDIACIGIGENGHIAFNDPHVADFQDPFLVKKVELDETSRVQQVNDGCFDKLEQVPTTAITLTIPAILSASAIFCTVPGDRKKKAVKDTVHGPISVECPASILRNARECRMYLDEESASLL